MGKLDKDYQNLVKDILENGHNKGDRTGTGTRSVFGRQIRHKMSDGFPLLTTKKMYTKGIITELLWFLRGDTDIRFLWKNNNHIWDGDWYKNYCKQTSSPYSLEEMIQFGLEWEDNPRFFHKSIWDLGPIYGKQWRKWGTNKLESFSGIDYDGCKPIYIDQFKNSINLLKTDPDSRRNIVSAWNVGEMKDMVLPPCHNFFQFYTRELTWRERADIAKNVLPKEEYDKLGYISPFIEPIIHHWLNQRNIPKRTISLMWNQRSVDTGLGLPFNIASYALLLELVGKMVNMVPEELIGNLGDVHLYNNHIEPIQEQLNRKPYKLPKLSFSDLVDVDIKKYINKEGMDLDLFLSRLKVSDFIISDYESHPTIKLPLSN